jgi:hypothetical protein
MAVPASTWRYFLFGVTDRFASINVWPDFVYHVILIPQCKHVLGFTDTKCFKQKCWYNRIFVCSNKITRFFQCIRTRGLSVKVQSVVAGMTRPFRYDWCCHSISCSSSVKILAAQIRRPSVRISRKIATCSHRMSSFCNVYVVQLIFRNSLFRMGSLPNPLLPHTIWQCNPFIAITILWR